MLREDDVYLEQPSRYFCQLFMRRTTQQTFFDYKLGKWTSKLYFSSQLRKQFKLLTVPFKPLRWHLRSDKLVNSHVWKFYKDLFLKFCVIWSFNQIVLFNGFLSDLLRSLRVYVLKKLFFSISVNGGFRNIYLVAARLSNNLATIHLDFKEYLLNYHARDTKTSRTDLATKKILGI